MCVQVCIFVSKVCAESKENYSLRKIKLQYDKLD